MTNKRTVYGKKLLTAAVLVSMLPGGLAFAEEALPLYTLDTVVVTATRTENDEKNVPASTQIITSSDIKKSGATNVRDAITDFANITMTKKVRGGGHEIIIRGMSTDKSLIMVNGHRVANEADASGLGNANALDRINLKDVQKIEIVKGPSSALYGSEAMGGVINIITKPSVEPSVSTGLEFTTDNTNHWWHFDSGRQGRFSATADARVSKEKRQMTENDTSSNNYGTARTYNASLNYYFNDDNYLNFYVDYFSQHLQSDRGTPAMKDFPVSMGPMKLNGKAMIDGGGHARNKQKNYGLSWNGKTNRNDWKLQTYVSQFDWSSNSNQKVLQTIPGADPMSQSAYDRYVKQKYGTYDFHDNSNSLWALEGRDTFTINEHHKLTFGAEYTKNKIKGTGLGANGDNAYIVTQNGKSKERSEKELTTYSAYIQDEMSYGKWFVIPAVRYDHNSFYGNYTSPKLGVTYKAKDNFRIKANYGKGFKAPTVMQLFYDLVQIMGTKDGRPNWQHVQGDPNLKPETSTSWDLGVEGEFGKAYGSLTYFDTDVDDLISTVRLGVDNNGYPLSRYTNVNQAKIKGVENTLGYKFNSQWGFKVNSTWLSAKDTSNHVDLAQRAKLSQIYALTFDDGKERGWGFTLWDEFCYKYTTPVDAGRDVAAGPKKTFNTLNFSITGKVNKDTRFYGSVRNIFDKVADDCDLDGRFYSLGWEHKF